ncbi:MAG TPA: hypothetical protein VMG31_17055 [Verrucomicrobiae bacterium]|nr:hypothetical protein [Verrucomicrobiae bacterium]
MSDSAKARIAIVAALEREVRPLVRRWQAVEREYSGRRFKFFAQEDAVVVCGGMGAEAGRRAAEAVIALYAPQIVYSAGFAGALDPELVAGAVMRPARVVNAGDGSSVRVNGGKGVLVTFGMVASAEQKANLRESFAAQAVDMEAAAVARAAEGRGIRFAAVKAISDGADFTFPAMQRFVDSAGKFSEARFAWYAAWRPWLWGRVMRMARDSSHAAEALCEQLQAILLDEAAEDPAKKEAVEGR